MNASAPAKRMARPLLHRPTPLKIRAIGGVGRSRNCDWKAFAPRPLSIKFFVCDGVVETTHSALPLFFDCAIYCWRDDAPVLPGRATSVESPRHSLRAPTVVPRHAPAPVSRNSASFGQTRASMKANIMLAE